MSDSFGTKPQFDTAEFKPNGQGDVCSFCSGMVGDTYYRVHGKMACTMCASKVQSELPKKNVFMKSLMYGMGGAFLGMVIYSTVVILSGWTIGYLSLAVGFLVAKAMMMGSNGIGGRKFQIAAVILTYAAVAFSAIPISMKYAKSEPKVESTQQKDAASQQKDASESSGLVSLMEKQDPKKHPIVALAVVAVV